MKIFKEVDVDHRDDEEAGLIAAAVLGDKIERAILNPTNPFGAMMIRARDEFIAAQQALLLADLHTTDGMEQARSLQAQARRYHDMCRWITDAWDDRDEAEELIEGAQEEPAVEELKDIQNGNRAKPAPDA